MRAGRARQPGVQGRAQEALRHRRHQPRDGRYLECRQLRRRRRIARGAWPGRCASCDTTRPTTATSGRSKGCGRSSISTRCRSSASRSTATGRCRRGSATTRPTASRISARDIKPLEITQPDGPSFEVERPQVRWQNWSFVIGFNAREGLTLHHLRYRDGGRDRSILYRASLTEMVVPYGDPGPTQRRKNAFDVGEYGMGMCANSLELGCDCLGHDPLLRRPHVHQPRRAADDQERHLHARGGLRHPLEAHRPPPSGRARGAPLAAAGRSRRSRRSRTTSTASSGTSTRTATSSSKSS